MKRSARNKRKVGETDIKETGLSYAEQKMKLNSEEIKPRQESSRIAFAKY